MRRTSRAVVIRLIPAHAGKTLRGGGASRGRRAHPRSRGENTRSQTSASHAAGSSPLTRGKLRWPNVEHLAHGLIPAHAGKTTLTPLFSRTMKAHPRSRGENLTGRRDIFLRGGSSPLTRGKLGLPALHLASARLIPAHAGKTHTVFAPSFYPGAHPRSRGENDAKPAIRLHPEGSSPLTRGKRLRAFYTGNGVRLIPAHAGKTAMNRVQAVFDRAHPRSLWENSFVALIVIVPPGSSPLTRGKRSARELVLRGGGLIPAHAGKTADPAGVVRLVWAHPRSRGENCSRANSASAFAGSSPLTRGKREFVELHVEEGGLIPAHAGKTLMRSTAPDHCWAHPRSRGENCVCDEVAPDDRGSSPLTRGKRDNRDLRWIGPGLIPAHAGKTRGGRRPRAPVAAHPRSRGENGFARFRRGGVRGSSPLTRGKRRRRWPCRRR